jgi:sigma54-dependent transcription regulator
VGLRLVDHRSRLAAPHGEKSRAKRRMSVNIALRLLADAAQALDRHTALGAYPASPAIFRQDAAQRRHSFAHSFVTLSFGNCSQLFAHASHTSAHISHTRRCADESRSMKLAQVAQKSMQSSSALIGLVWAWLRVLQEREFRRLGGTRSIAVNVRVIVATNRDLREAVARAAFRADLYYRVNVFEIRVPPLRHRGEDIIPLARRFLHEFSRTNNAPVTALAPDAIAALVAYQWPGNVRELQNVIERASIVCDGGVIHESDLMLAQEDTVAEDRTRLSDLEQRAIAHAMREVNGNRSKAARQLGISRTQLYARLRKYGLESSGR